MFKCRECGCEFNTKPEYCDCGNNTFDEIQTKTLQTMPDFKQLISVLIFVLCVILAIIPWTIKDKTPIQKPVVQKAQPVIGEIPDIEKIWNSAPIQVKQPEPIPEPVAIKEIVNPEPTKITPKPKKTEAPENVQKSKPVTKPATKKEQPKPVSQTNTVSKPKPTQQTTSMQKSNVNPKSITVKPIDKTPLINYRNELRIALLSKLNVPNIQGSGDCAVSFSIDENGKLLNRKFIYKSNNKTVNDEVYYMLMRLPNFKKPPELYKGETIKLKFYINNGYYEISFI